MKIIYSTFSVYVSRYTTKNGTLCIILIIIVVISIIILVIASFQQQFVKTDSTASQTNETRLEESFCFPQTSGTADATRMKRRIATSAYPTVPYQPASENRDLTLGWWNPAAFRKRPVYREQVRDTVLLLRLSSYSLSLSLFLSFFLSLSSRLFCALARRRRRVCPASVHSARTRTHERTHALTRPPRNAQDGLRGE